MVISSTVPLEHGEQNKNCFTKKIVRKLFVRDPEGLPDA